MIPIPLLITIGIFGLVIVLSYLFLYKLAKGNIPLTVVNEPQQPSLQNPHSTQSNVNRPNNNNVNQSQRAPNVIQPNVIDPNKKLTKKEQLKMMKKQEKAEQREYQKQMLEAKKLREQQKEKEMLLKEQMKAEEKKKLEEELQKLKEEQEKKDNEIYNQWKDMIKVGEEGEERVDFNDENVINDFLNYIKIRKVVSLEDLSGVFKIPPNDLVDKLNFFEQQGRILGIIDDRGKYIYITEKEMSMIEKMFMNRGRITKAELIKECNRLIKFEPTEEDKVKIAEEQKKMLEKIENEISDNNTNAKK